MKLGGSTLLIPNEVIIPILRSRGNIYFLAVPVEDTELFEAMVRKPQPPMMDEPGKSEPQPVMSDKYLKAMENYNEIFITFIVVKSLKSVARTYVNPVSKEKQKITEPVVWETVDLNDINTYKNYETELRSSGFTAGEITRIINGALEANSLTQQGVDKAREDFLAFQEVGLPTEFTHQDANSSTPFGEPANV